MKSSNWFRRIFRYRIFVALLILLQFAFIAYTIISNSAVSEIAYSAMVLVSFFVVLHVIVSRDKPAYKISLVFLILSFPLFGGVFYLVYKLSILRSATNKRMKDIEQNSREYFRLHETAANEALERFPEFSAQINYLDGYMGFPVYKNTDMRYYPSGEAMMDALCAELEKAEKYIFLEFFIVREGELWGRMEKILTRQAENGVDVRLIYDDMGCFKGFTDKKVRELEEKGIKISVFNRFIPFISSVQNNRDHRKIAVVDGKIAFTGGVNVSDEYVNITHPHGHWKDAAVSLRGDGAWSFTVMFLQMWSLCEGVKEEYRSYFPNGTQTEGGGFVAPYCDSPMDGELLGERVYSQLIVGAREYLYITTPYLIVDDDILSSLRLAAKSGVDVRIITPCIYDKFLVHMTTRTYYETLIEAGVRIYEYTPGFIHSKSFVSDDKRAVVGTVNLDFRSLYLHFECGALIYGDPVIKDIKNDFLKTAESCREITLKDCKRNIFSRFTRSLLRLFAPIM